MVREFYPDLKREMEAKEKIMKNGILIVKKKKFIRNITKVAKVGKKVLIKSIIFFSILAIIFPVLWMIYRFVYSDLLSTSNIETGFVTEISKGKEFGQTFYYFGITNQDLISKPKSFQFKSLYTPTIDYDAAKILTDLGVGDKVTVRYSPFFGINDVISIEVKVDVP